MTYSTYAATPRAAQVKLGPALGRHVLVVDDSPSERQFVASVLRQQGWSVLLGRDGLEAVSLARQYRPDGILLDVVMGRHDGLSACRHLTALMAQGLLPAIPIVLMSVKGQDVDVAWGLRQGAARYLIKPFTGAQLIAAVRDVLPL